MCVWVCVGGGRLGLVWLIRACFLCMYFRCMKCFLGLVCGMNAGECALSVMAEVSCVMLALGGVLCVGVVWVGEGVGSMYDGTGSAHSERFAESELVLVLCVGVVVSAL